MWLKKGIGELMFPAYLLRAAIDWTRHADEFKDSNPYSRCESTIKTFQTLWEEQIGKANMQLLEPSAITAYWSEFFNAEDPLADEEEWRDGLIKQSGQYDAFDQWQTSFKKTYAKVYKEDNIWLGVLMTSWAHTHQYDVAFVHDAWEFRPASSYLPTIEMWRAEPHMKTVSEMLNTMWMEEMELYEEAGFTITEESLPYIGRVECLGFDTTRYLLNFPPQANKDPQPVDLGDMVADIIFPPGDDWYRHLDNVIFAGDCLDITALNNRTKYIFGSKRRLLQLSLDGDMQKAMQQAAAEGWLVPKMEEASVLV